jgi:hypothetical protein
MAMLRGGATQGDLDVANAPEPPSVTRDDVTRLGPPPAVQEANPHSAELTDAAYRRAMDIYNGFVRDGLVQPGDSYVAQPIDDAGNPIFGKDLHFDTRTGRSILRPSTLPPARERTPMEILKDYLNRDYFAPFKSPPPPMTGGGKKGDVVPVDPSLVFAARLRQGRR